MKLAAALATAVLLVAGCGASAEPDPSPTSSSRDEVKEQDEAQGAEQDEAQGAVVDIVIKGGKATPQGERVEVKVGDKVTLTATSDVAEELHVHSDPEHTYQVGAGDSIRKTFTLDKPGQVAVEAHHLGVTVVQLVVRP